MANAEELLYSALSSVAEHTHRVVDSDTYFIIDPITRLITNTAFAKNVIMQFDHESERFTFELPRYVEGHDMMLCNVVKVHWNNIYGESGIENADVNDIVDLRVDPKNPDNVICSWLISRHSTQLPGILSFLVQYMCTDDEGNALYEWHSDIFSDIEVRAGRNNSDGAVIEYSDILEQWRARLFGNKDSLVAEIEAASAAQIAEIEAKAAETLDTIPDDYTTTYNMADEALRRKAEALHPVEQGTALHIDDSSDSYLMGLKVLGKTTQLTSSGKNIFNCPDVPGVSKNNITYKCIDGVWSILGYPSSNYTIIYATTDITSIFDQGRQYTLSQTVTFDNYKTGGSVYAQLDAIREDGTYERYMSVDGPKTFIVDKDEFPQYTIKIMTGGGVGKVTLDDIRFQIEASNTQTDWEIYSGKYASPHPSWPQAFRNIQSPTVMLSGRNLFNKDATKNSGGSSYTVTGNSVSVKQTGTSHWISANWRIPALENSIGEYVTISCQTKSTDINLPTVRLQWLTSNGTSVSFGDDNAIKTASGTSTQDFTMTCKVPRRPHNGDYLALMLYSNTDKALTDSSKVYECTYENVQVEFGRAATVYKPYQAIQAITPNYILNGLPAMQASKPNYIDENGQQWVCDEIDYGRGKYIQRIKHRRIAGDYTPGINTYQLGLGFYAFEYYFGDISDSATNIPVMSDKFPSRGWGSFDGHNGVYCVSGRVLFSIDDPSIKTADDFKAWTLSNPIEVIYELKEPIETDLTSVEMEAFRALHSNYHITNVTNDKNAVMDVDYVADIEKYIMKNVTQKSTKFDITLTKAGWVKSTDSMYHTQVVNYTAGANSKVDLHPTPEQLISLINDGIAMFLGNENGVVTAYCVGGTPGADMTIRATETVVVYT